MNDTDSLQATREPFNVRKGPALIVVGIALFIIILFGIFATLSSNSPPKAAPKVTKVVTNKNKPDTSSVNVVSAVGVLKQIQDNGSLPSDIEHALVVPAGSNVSGNENLDGDAGQYDREITLVAPYRATTLVKCYQNELPRLGWTLSATQPNTNVNGTTGTEVLAQHLSSDGYYWEVGVIVSNNSETISPALSGSSATTSSSTIHMELLEVPDAN